MAEDYKRRGVEVCFARVSEKQRKQMEMARIVKILGRDHFHRSINSAIKFLSDFRKKQMIKSRDDVASGISLQQQLEQQQQQQRKQVRRKKSGSIKLFEPQPHLISEDELHSL